MSEDIRRAHGSGNSMHCHRDDHRLWQEIMLSRYKAHEKHGANSIEAIPADDPRWLSILIEEIGEAAHEQTYDSGGTTKSLRAELIDIASVVTAWISAIDNPPESAELLRQREAAVRSRVEGRITRASDDLLATFNRLHAESNPETPETERIQTAIDSALAAPVWGSVPEITPPPIPTPLGSQVRERNGDVWTKLQDTTDGWYCQDANSPQTSGDLAGWHGVTLVYLREKFSPLTTIRTGWPAETESDPS